MTGFVGQMESLKMRLKIAQLLGIPTPRSLAEEYIIRFSAILLGVLLRGCSPQRNKNLCDGHMLKKQTKQQILKYHTEERE